MTTLALAGLLLLGSLAAVPVAAAGRCEVTNLAAGYKLVACDSGDDGLPNYFCVTGPRLGPCQAP